MYATQDIPPFKTLPELEKYDSPEKNAKNRAKKATKWSQDMWGVGCLIWEVFNGVLPRSSSLKVLGKVIVLQIQTLYIFLFLQSLCL